MTGAVLTAGTVLWCLLPQLEDRFLRTKTGFDTLQEYFKLGVNFGQALVNRHRIELFILDQEGRIAVTFTRLQWDIQDVLHHAYTLVTPNGVGYPLARPG
jgi:hypothetical protein